MILKDILLGLTELCLTGNNGPAGSLRNLIVDVRRGDRPLRDLVAKTPDVKAFKYPMTAMKTLIMLDRLDRDGYTSYWL
ncbi:MAG: hypothetical protein RDV00_09720 [Clostridia bacterium]|nr:hypothetical protein [Clostridia bacterium]MDQ7792380.1 hypothetical protein [Clostridia bacterium]